MTIVYPNIIGRTISLVAALDRLAYAIQCAGDRVVGSYDLVAAEVLS